MTVQVVGGVRVSPIERILPNMRTVPTQCNNILIHSTISTSSPTGIFL